MLVYAVHTHTHYFIIQVSTWFANCRRRLKKANQEEEERNNYNSYHEESSPQRPSSQSPQRPSSRSPGSESPESGRHDSDDKQNYSTVTPTLHADEFSVSCTCKLEEVLTPILLYYLVMI